MSEKENGCVYFLKHVGLTPIKIGYSNNENPINRFNQFKTYAPYGSELVGFIITSDAKKLETELHKKYSNDRLSGEWFDLTREQAEKDIEFHSNLEDIKRKNDFQLAWAKENIIETLSIDLFISSRSETSKHELSKLVFKKFPDILKRDLANHLGISRNTLYRHLNK